MVNIEQVNASRIKLEKELDAISPEISRRFPVAEYMEAVKKNSKLQQWFLTFRAQKLKKAFEHIALKYGTHALTVCYKLSLCTFIQDALTRIERMILTDEVINLYHEWFQGVLDDFSTQPDDYYDIRRKPFALDVNICTLRNIPLGGAWILETRSIGLRPFFSGGVKQFFNCLQFTALTARGFSPFFSTHIAEKFAQPFDEQEMNLIYQRISALMKLHPHVKGYYRNNWFLDPNLENISPRLGYMRKVPLQNGAKLFASGSTRKDIDYSLSKSSTRRKLYEQGKYLPTGYTLIWPRKAFLAFVEQSNFSHHP